jgi:hypothetical protein
MENKMKVSVSAHTWASATVTVEIPNEKLENLARELDKQIDELTVEDIDEIAQDLAFTEGFPGICAQCSGWGRNNKSMDIGTDWEPDENDAVQIIER